MLSSPCHLPIECIDLWGLTLDAGLEELVNRCSDWVSSTRASSERKAAAFLGFQLMA